MFAADLCAYKQSVQTHHLADKPCGAFYLSLFSPGHENLLTIKMFCSLALHCCSQDCLQESHGFILQKAEMPFECHDFCWNLSRVKGSSKDLVMIQNDNDRGIVMLATVDGDLTTLSTRWNQMYTVVKFWWGNRSYRCIQNRLCTMQY